MQHEIYWGGHTPRGSLLYVHVGVGIDGTEVIPLLSSAVLYHIARDSEYPWQRTFSILWHSHNDTVFFCHAEIRVLITIPRIPITGDDHNHNGLDDYGTYGSKFYTKSCRHRAVGFFLDVSLP